MAPRLRTAGLLGAILLVIGGCSGSGQSGSSPDDADADAGSRVIVEVYLDELAAVGGIDSFGDDRAAVEYARRANCLGDLPGPVAAEVTMDIVALLDALAAETVASTTAMEQQTEVDRALRDDSDAAVADLNVSLDDLVPGPGSLANAVETYRTGIADIATVRSAVDGRQMSTMNARQQMTDTASNAIDVVWGMAAEVDDSALSQELSSMVDLLQAQRETMVVNAVVAGVIVRGGWMDGNGVMVVGDPPFSEVDGVAEVSSLWSADTAVTTRLAAWEQSDPDAFAAWVGFGDRSTNPPYGVALREALAASESASAIPLALDEWLELQQDELDKYSRTMESRAEGLSVTTDFSLGVEVDNAVRDACEAVDDRILEVDPATVD